MIPPSQTTLRRRNVGDANGENIAYPDQDDDKKKKVRKVVRNLDIFPKVEQDLTVRTDHGGLITLIGYGVIIFFVMCEFIAWVGQNRETVEHLVLDTSLGKKMRVNLNITFPALPCEDLHLDVMDVAGDSQLDIEDTLVKRRLHLDGSPMDSKEIETRANRAKVEQEKSEQLLKDSLSPDYCGPCYGAHDHEEHCCQTCDEVKEAYKAKRWNVDSLMFVAEQCMREGAAKKEPKKLSQGEGCNLSGYMMLNRVSGNFHIAMGEGIERDGRHIHIFLPEDTINFNASHVVHELSFGPRYTVLEKGALNGVTKYTTMENGGTGLFQYFIKVVPTIYKNKVSEKSKDAQETNRYFFTERFRPLMTEPLPNEEKEESTTAETQAGDAAGGNQFHGKHHGIMNSVLPGVFFVYEIYPFAVEVTKTNVSLTHLLIRVMALAGGVFTITGWIDGMLYSREKKKKKGHKLRNGK